MSLGMNWSCAVPSCCNASLQSPQTGKCFPFPDQNSLSSFDRDGKTVYYSRRKLWIDNLGLNDNRLIKNAVICSLHFKEQDFSVSEDGITILKDDAIPRPTLNTSGTQVNERKGHKQNDIETGEKGDDFDDDIEIIEPHREVITLDDDEDESQKATPLTESNSVVGQKENSVEKSVPEVNTKNDDQDVSIKKQEESNLPLTCLSSETSAHSNEDIAKKQTNSTKSEVIPPSNVSAVSPKKIGVAETVNPSQDITIAKSENLNLTLKCISLDGDKVFVHIPNPGLSKTVPTPAARGKARENPVMKFDNIPDISKKSTPKETTENRKVEIKDARGQIVPAEDSIKQQLSMILNKKDLKMPVFKSSSPKLVRLLSLPKSLNLAGKNIKNPPNNLVDPKFTLSKEVTPPLRNDLIRVGNGLIVRSLKDTEVYYPTNKILQFPQADKQQISKENNKNKKDCKTQKNRTNRACASRCVDETTTTIGHKVKQEVLDEEDKQRTTREIGTQTDGGPVGFADMYKFVKDHMIDFTFDVFGKTYTLQECALNFLSTTSGTKAERKIAIVSKTNLSSKDTLLLGSMHISIGLDSSTQSSQLDEYVKEIGAKSEKICKKPTGKINEYINNCARKTSSNQNFNATKTNEKTIIFPNSVKANNLNKGKTGTDTTTKASKNSSKVDSSIDNKVTDKTVTMTEEELTRHRRNLMKKKKSLLKSTLARSRKASRLPVSQMNPTLRGRLNIDRNRFKKTKKSVHESEKKKRLLESLDSVEPKENDNKVSVSTSDSFWGNISQGDSSEDKTPVKTRSTTRGKKKDYRTLSTNGTTEDVKKTPKKRKSSVSKAVKSKKAKYSDKVGAIESFLEVVLEPDNDEFNQSVNESEKDDDGNPHFIPHLLSLVNN